MCMWGERANACAYVPASSVPAANPMVVEVMSSAASQCRPCARHLETGSCSWLWLPGTWVLVGWGEVSHSPSVLAPPGGSGSSGYI